MHCHVTMIRYQNPKLLRGRISTWVSFGQSASLLLRYLDRAIVRLTGSPKPQPFASDPFEGLLPWELTTKASLMIPQIQHSNENRLVQVVDDIYAARLIDFAGLCLISKAVDSTLIARCNSSSSKLTEEVRSLVRARGIDPDNPTTGFSFKGAHQRDPGRLDLRNHYAMDEEPFNHPSLNENAAWIPVVKTVLGDDFKLLWKGLVVTEPGTGEQDYHPDGPPVSRTVWQQFERVPSSSTASLPAHCLTVFVPLIDLSASAGTPEAGPTSFLPGTHHDMTVLSLEAEASDPGSSSGVGSPTVLDVCAGDAIVFNVRVRHAGSANRSAVRRPVLYLVYGRWWYDVALHTRLLEDGGFAQPGVEAERIFKLREEK